MANEESTTSVVSDEMPVPRIRHDWYQTDTHVIVTILAKNAKNIKVTTEQNTLSVSAQLPSGNEYSLEIDLAHSVISEDCSFKVVPSKIEIKLKKQDAVRWATLEGNSAAQNIVQPIPQGKPDSFATTEEILQAGNQPLKYPSSCKNWKDWDKMNKEIEKQEAQEKPEGEAALNALFQQIYGSGSDEVRRAMNKSFQESGGTVLSTNWSEVCKGKVEKKPPDGVEWKTWSA